MSLCRLCILIFSLYHLASSERREKGEGHSAISGDNKQILGRNFNTKTVKREASNDHIISIGDALQYLAKKFIENTDHDTEIDSLGNNGSVLLHIGATRDYKSITNLLLGNDTRVDNKVTFYNAPIHDAVYNGNYSVVKTLLENGARINDRGKFGLSPLHIAAFKGYETIVNLLLKRNANVDIKDMFNRTPLHNAVTNGNLNIVNVLLDHGANINNTANLGYTPLHIAALKGYEKIIDLLLSRNASVETKDIYNDAPIHFAVYIGKIPLNLAVRINLNNLEESGYFIDSEDNRFEFTNIRRYLPRESSIIAVMKAVIGYGADVNSQNLYGQTVLHETAAIGYADVVTYLLSQNASLEIEDYMCYTPILRAANKHNIKVIKSMLDYGDNINRVGCHNITSLYLATEQNSPMLAGYLLSKKADPNIMSEEGRTPLDIAFLKSSEDLIKLLLKYGAKIEDKSFLGSKVLFDVVSKKSLNTLNLLLNSIEFLESYPTVILNYAIGVGFIDAVKLLIELGANIEKRDIHDNIPLSSAVMSKNVEMVKLILEASMNKVAKKNFTSFMNADSTIKLFNSQNNKTEFHQLTALHIASYHGLTEIVGLLISYGASLEVRDERGYAPLHYACEEGNFEVVKLLLDHGAKKDVTTSVGTTPLQIACRIGMFPIVQSLLSHPTAAIDDIDNHGYTALHFAALSGSQEIVKLLLNHNANKEAKTDDLKTPLHLASLQGQKEAAKVLIEAGANKQALDIDDMTPLHLAARERQSDMVKLLLSYKAYFPNYQNKNGSSPVHVACQRHSKSNRSEINILKMLLTSEILLNLVDNNLMTALHIASRDNSPGCVEVLLSFGSNLFYRDKLLNIPVHYAALNGNFDIILMLLRKTRILSTQVNYKKETPLFLASREGHLDIVRLLLQIGNEGLIPDANGRTALHRSACRGHTNIVKVLRKHGANKDKEDKWGFTALNYAASWKGHQEVIGYLSKSLLNITLSSYLDRSNPVQTEIDRPIKAMIDKIKAVTLNKTSIGNRTRRNCGSPIVEQKLKNKKLVKHVVESSPFYIAFNNATTNKNAVDLLFNYNTSARYIFNNTPLHEAVSHANLNLVKKLLENGADINSRGEFGSTPLHIAAKEGDETIVNFLLKKNASVGIRDMYNNTPIHYGVYNGNINILKALLDYSDKIDDKGNLGLTPLHIAAQKGYEAIVNLLLKRNATVDIRDDSNMAPIHYGARKGYLNVVKALLDHGSDVNCDGKSGYRPLHIAAGKGYEDIVEFLLERNASVNIRDNNNDAPIIFATYHNNKNIIEILLDHGADINHRGNLGYTPLHIASSYGFEDIVDFLLSRNASVDIRDINDDAPINFAIFYGKLNVINSLLDHGSSIDTKGGGGRTPLHIAVWKSPELVDLLLERNATVNIKNNNGDAPIHSAAINNNLYAVKALLDHGADINDRGFYESTPIHIAALHGYECIFNLLLERNASFSTKDSVGNAPLHEAVKSGILNIVKAIVDRGANINEKGHFGYTPLHIAALKGFGNIVDFLLEKKASMEIRDNFNDVPLHTALVAGYIKVIILLLDHGANVNTKGATGNTPFNLAVRIKINNLNESQYFRDSSESTINFNNSRRMRPVENKIIIVMKLLLERGADVNSQNFYDQTVLHEAAVNGYDAVVEYLLSQNASLGFQDYLCYTPLHWAAQKLEAVVIKTLLDHGDNINRVGCNNITALYISIERKYPLLTEYLLYENADPNVMSEEGRTPLDVAFSRSSDETIKLLLEHGAKVEDKSFLGSKILFDAISKKMLTLVKRLLESTEQFESYPTVILNYAIRMKYLEVVKLLVDFGGDIEKIDIHGNLPLSSAVISKNVEMVKLILQSSARKVPNENFTNFINAESEVTLFSYNNVTEVHRLTALHIASYYGLMDIVELLISYRASLEVRDERGYTPLHFACEKEHMNVVKLLLDSGANSDSVDDSGITPLHIACRLGSFAIGQSLLSHSPIALNKSDNYGYTALHYAALGGSKELVTLLLNLGANKEAKTNDIKTPLHLASLKGQTDIADILLTAGANIEAVDIDGMTPLHFAARERHEDVVRLMLDLGPNSNIRNKNGSTSLHLACVDHINFIQKEINIVSMLLHSHYNVNAINYKHMTPLHIASRDNSYGCAEVLLANGGSVFSRDKFLNLPIHYAALHGNSKIMFMLLTKYRILSTEVNSVKETPLFLASREGHTEVVEMLLQIGVEGLIPDANGRTALHRSACRGHLEIVTLLRQRRANKDKEDRWGFTALSYAASWKGHQDVIGYLSTSLQNITLTSYFDKSNPFQNQL